MRNLPAPIQVTAQALTDWWDDWVNLVIVNLAWILCWLTVLLGPPPELTLADDECRALDALAAGGLVPPLRLVTHVSGPVVESA